MNPVICPSVSLYLYRDPVDFRKSFKELAVFAPV